MIRTFFGGLILGLIPVFGPIFAGHLSAQPNYCKEPDALLFGTTLGSAYLFHLLSK